MGRNLLTWTWQWLKRHRIIGIVFLVTLPFLVFILRGWIQPLFLSVRLNIAPVLLALAFLGLTGWWWKRGHQWLASVGTFMVVGWTVALSGSPAWAPRIPHALVALSLDAANGVD